MAGDVDHVINTSHDPEIAVLITTRSVPCEVHSGNLAPVLFLIALGVAVDRSQHRRPRSLQNEKTSLIRSDGISLTVNDVSDDSGKWPRRRSGFCWNCTGNGRDHDGPCFG